MHIYFLPLIRGRKITFLPHCEALRLLSASLGGCKVSHLLDVLFLNKKMARPDFLRQGEPIL